MAELKRGFALVLAVLLAFLVVTPVFAEVRESAGAEPILLLPQNADLFDAPGVVVEPYRPPYNLGGWEAGNTVRWQMTIREAGLYTLHIEYARPGSYPAAMGLIQVEGQGVDSTLPFEVQPTGGTGGGDDWSVYAVNSDCSIQLEPGDYMLSVWPDPDGSGPSYFINLRGIALTKEGQTLLLPSDAGWEAASGSTQSAVAEGSGQVHDYADIFTDAEEAELRSKAEAYAASLGVHLVILTTDDASQDVLETYSRDFYETNIAGVDGIYECAMMTANMGTRRVANDFYGELRTMVSDEEASVIREGYTPDLTEGNHAAAARYFLDETAALVEAKLREYRIDIPAADPFQLVYDYADVLLEEELAQLAADARALSGAMGVPHFIVITESSGDEDYLKRYASSFYKQNLGAVGGCLILTVSADKSCAVSPFGSYLPKNSLLWDMTDEVSSRLTSQSIYAGCRYFLGEQSDKLQAVNYQMPELDLAQLVYDFTDSLTPEEEESLRREIEAVFEQYGVNLYIVLSDIASHETLSAFRDGFSDLIDGDWNRDNSVALIVGAAPELEGESREAYIIRNGKKTYRKISYSQSGKLCWTAESLVGSGAAYSGCQIFVSGVAEHLGSLIPNVEMVENIDWVLQNSVLAALIFPCLTILILRLLHGFKRARKVPARSYLVNGSVALDYSRDVFIGSHTTQTKIQKESSSGGGGSSGSSGGGISSRSEGSF